MTFIRSGGFPKCGRCKTIMPYWDFREDESTYRCDECQSIEVSESMLRIVQNHFKNIKK